MGRIRVLWSISFLVACGSQGASEGADAGGSSTTATGATEGGAGPTGDTMSGGTTSGGGDATSSGGEVTTGGGETTTGAVASSTGDTDDSTGGLLLDVGSETGGPGCTMDGTEPPPYVWIANSPQGTISKIDTQTMVEEGRYIVRPDSAGSPSRTSVSLSGDVAVANRLGGVTKVYADPEDCPESNGMPGLQTSTGGGDIVPWGTEECVAWHTPLAYSSNRPMAWAQGVWDEESCGYVEEKLWTAGANGSGTTQVLLLDGDSGVVEQTVDIPEIQSSIGLYGGAVDGDGNFWAIETGGVRLVRVDRDAFSYQLWDGPGVASYGITVDAVGRPWFCAGGGASRFDPGTQTWETLPSPGGNAWGGCMTDGMGTLWHCRQQDSTLVGIDTETLAVVQQIPLPAYAHGISLDFDGNVWAVGFVSTQAYRVDPGTGTIDTFDGLVGAYTYSDMTGFALASVGVSGG